MYSFENIEVLLALFVPLICYFFCKKIVELRYFPNINFFNFGKNINIKKLLQLLLFISLVISLASPFYYDSNSPNNRFGLNIMLSIDASGSMNDSGFDKSDKFKTKFEIVKDVAKEFVIQRENDNFGVTLFGDFAFVSSPISYDSASVAKFIDRYDLGVAGNSTAIGEALYKSAKALNITNSKSKIIILLTDGKHNSGQISPQKALSFINKSGIKVYTISIGDDTDIKLLNQISSKSGANSYIVQSKDELNEIFSKIDNLENSKIRSSEIKEKILLFQYPLIFASIFTLLLLIIKPIKIDQYYYSMIFILVLILIAMSRPISDNKIDNTDIYINDLIIALDLSYSMSGDDIKPNRFEYAKARVKELIQKVNSRITLLGFTTNAVILSPPTLDKHILATTFDMIQMSEIVNRGTNIYSALKLSANIIKNREKYLLIVGDGGDKKNFTKEIKFAKEHKIKVLFYSIATSGGVILKEDGKSIYDNNNNLVVSQSNIYLSSLVNNSGGKIYKYSEFIDLVKDINRLSMDDEKIQKITTANEYFRYFIALAILILIFTRYKLPYLNHIFILFLFYLPNTLNATTLQNLKRYNSANILYKKAKYKEAIKLYLSVQSSNREFKSYTLYNLANAYAKIGEFDRAKRSYKNSLILKYDKDAIVNLMMISRYKALQTKNKRVKDKKKDTLNGDNKKNSKKENYEKVQGSSKYSLGFKFYQELNKRSHNESKPW